MDLATGSSSSSELEPDSMAAAFSGSKTSFCVVFVLLIASNVGIDDLTAAEPWRARRPV